MDRKVIAKSCHRNHAATSNIYLADSILSSVPSPRPRAAASTILSFSQLHFSERQPYFFTPFFSTNFEKLTNARCTWPSPSS